MCRLADRPRLDRHTAANEKAIGQLFHGRTGIANRQAVLGYCRHRMKGGRGRKNIKMPACQKGKRDNDRADHHGRASIITTHALQTLRRVAAYESYLASIPPKY